MRITICGSIAFYEEMLLAQDVLERRGHEVRLPPATVSNEQGAKIPVMEYYALRKMAGDQDMWIWGVKAEAIRTHFEKIVWSEAVLVINPTKNDVPGYIGSNTLMELGLAFFLKRPIYLLHEIPVLPCREELLAMSPTVIHGDYSLIKL